MQNELKPICFPVEKVPSVSLSSDPDMEYNSENAYAIVATIPAAVKPRRKTLNYCSGIYNLIENASILEPMIPILIERFRDIKVTVSNDKDAQFYVRISPVVPSFTPNTTVILPMLTFSNSYDGKVLAQATGGLVYYQVDAKGNVSEYLSTYLEGLSFRYTFKHSNENIYSMLGLAATIDKYLAEFGTVEAQVALLKAVDIKKATTAKLDKMVRNLAKGSVFPLKEVEVAIERIKYEMEVFDENPSLWSIYNAMNYVLETSEAKLSTKQRTDTDAKIYVNVLEFLGKQKPVALPELV